MAAAAPWRGGFGQWSACTVLMPRSALWIELHRCHFCPFVGGRMVSTWCRPGLWRVGVPTAVPPARPLLHPMLLPQGTRCQGRDARATAVERARGRDGGGICRPNSFRDSHIVLPRAWSQENTHDAAICHSPASSASYTWNVRCMTQTTLVWSSRRISSRLFDEFGERCCRTGSMKHRWRQSMRVRLRACVS